MSLYTLPNPPLPESITAYYSVKRAIEQKLPDHSDPGAFAQSLISIAQQHDVPIENIRNWLRYAKEFTVERFERWAQAYQGLRSQVLQVQKTKFCDCGHPLQMLDGSLFCAECGERAQC